MILRQLNREEIPSIFRIDRREVIHNVYHMRQGKLTLEPEFYDMQGFPPGEPEKYIPLMQACFDQGGGFLGGCDGDTLAGVVILANKWIGSQHNQLQLEFLSVSAPYRKTGLGGMLFHKAVEMARQKGARKLYISATPSENTIHFYQHMGCRLAEEIDPDLFALEPDDIHLEYEIGEPS